MANLLSPKMSKSFNTRKLFASHLTSICIFIAFEMSIYVVMSPLVELWEIVIYYILEIATFYISLLFILPITNQRGKKVIFILCVLLLLVVFCYFRIILLKFLYPVIFEQTVNAGNIDKMFARAAWRGTYIIGLSVVYWLFRRDKKAALDKKQLEIEKIEAVAEKRRIEVSLLQMQLEPHLIANVLAFVYNKIETTNPDAALAVERLSELMKHSNTDVISINKVPIKEEIEGIKTLIAIHDSLANSPLSFLVDIEVKDGQEEALIPPNLLSTFIDNIFTHGVVDDPAVPARVMICVDKSMFYFHCENAKSSTDFKGKSLGMNNVKGILNYFYKEQFELKVNESESYYSLDLKIAL